MSWTDIDSNNTQGIADFVEVRNYNADEDYLISTRELTDNINNKDNYKVFLFEDDDKKIAMSFKDTPDGKIRLKHVSAKPKSGDLVAADIAEEAAAKIKSYMQTRSRDCVIKSCSTGCGYVSTFPAMIGETLVDYMIGKLNAISVTTDKSVSGTISTVEASL